MNSTETNTVVLRQLARRLQDKVEFMASVLAQYQKQERVDDRALAEQLGVSTEMLVRLALCKRPKSESSQFAEQLRQIASFTHMDPGRLAMLLRHIESLEQFSQLPDGRQAPVGSGLLAAARDRDESQADESHEPDKPDDETDDVAG
jgi:hypothetical protein